jgi:DNA-binding transcriptional LysR family regulator
LDNEVDIGIIGGTTSSDMIVQEPLYEEELVLVLPVRHPLAKRPQINPKDVVNEPMLLPYAGRLTEYLQKCFFKKRVALKQLVTLGSRGKPCEPRLPLVMVSLYYRNRRQTRIRSLAC